MKNGNNEIAMSSCKRLRLPTTSLEEKVSRNCARSPTHVVVSVPSWDCSFVCNLAYCFFVFFYRGTCSASELSFVMEKCSRQDSAFIRKVSQCVLLICFNQFHPTGFILYILKISENIWLEVCKETSGMKWVKGVDLCQVVW